MSAFNALSHVVSQAAKSNTAWQMMLVGSMKLPGNTMRIIDERHAPSDVFWRSAAREALLTSSSLALVGLSQRFLHPLIQKIPSVGGACSRTLQELARTAVSVITLFISEWGARRLAPVNRYDHLKQGSTLPSAFADQTQKHASTLNLSPQQQVEAFNLDTVEDILEHELKLPENQAERIAEHLVTRLGRQKPANPFIQKPFTTSHLNSNLQPSTVQKLPIPNAFLPQQTSTPFRGLTPAVTTPSLSHSNQKRLNDNFAPPVGLYYEKVFAQPLPARPSLSAPAIR